MKIELVDDWHRSWRWASVRLAWLAGIAAGLLTLYPDELKGLVAYVPEQWRPAASLLIALVVGIAPWLARVTRKAPANG